MPSSHSTIRMIAMVSSMPLLPSQMAALPPGSRLNPLRSDCAECNLSARQVTLLSVNRTVVVVALLTLTVTASPVSAQQAAPSPQPNEHSIVATVKFVAGGALALAMHEGGHLVLD